MFQKACNAISVIVAIIGFICEICFLVNTSKYYISGEIVFGGVLLILVATALASLLFAWMGSVLEKLEQIADNTAMTKKNNQARAFQNSAVQVAKSAKAVSQGYWVCPKCGEMNLNQTAICSCGEVKPRTGNGNVWVCPKCGRVNQNYVGTCGCGEEKPK